MVFIVRAVWQPSLPLQPHLSEVSPSSLCSTIGSSASPQTCQAFSYLRAFDCVLPESIPRPALPVLHSGHCKSHFSKEILPSPPFQKPTLILSFSIHGLDLLLFQNQHYPWCGLSVTCLPECGPQLWLSAEPPSRQPIGAQLTFME